MLAFFFNRHSPVRMVVEVSGAFLLFVCLVRAATHTTPPLSTAALALLILYYGFARGCASVRWYRHAPRYVGIELHFLRTVTACGYLFTMILPLFLAFPHLLWLIVLIVVLLFFVHLNVAMLFFHWRDHDPTPVNHYSSGVFLKEFDASLLDKGEAAMLGGAHAGVR